MAAPNRTPSHQAIARGSVMPPSLSPSTIDNLGNAYGSMSLHNRTQNSALLGPGGIMASPFSSVGVGHLPSASQFGLHTAPVSVLMGMGAMYSPATPTQQLTNQYQAHFGNFGSFTHPQAPNPYSHFGQALSSPDSMPQIGSPLSMQRHGRRDFGHWSPSPGAFSQELTRFNPNNARRQNAQKVPNTSRRQHNPAASQHNHVDIGSIEQGKDVRTTVRCRIFKS
jgi:hypothetical protein